MVCECVGCCDTAFEDFPEFIYARIEWFSDSAALDVYVKMYKRSLPEYTTNLCKCLKCNSGVMYESEPIKTDLMSPGISRICCAGFALVVTCEEDIDDPGGVAGECEWLFYSSFMRSCEEAEPVAMTCLAEGSSALLLNATSMETCLDGDADLSDRFNATITFSESIPGGSPAEPCNKLCCPDLPQTLYITVESNCAALDGQVFEITRGSYTCESATGLPNNSNGSNSIMWSGSKKLCGSGACGNRYTASASTNTYSSNPQCAWIVSLGRTSPGLTDCYTDSVIEYDTELCLPITFAELTWGPEGDAGDEYCHDECCPELESVTVRLTLSE